MYGSVLPNDGLYVNPMRAGSLTPTSPSGSVSSESFYLHDPQEVIYNRVKDLFDSDCSSNKDTPVTSHPNALTGSCMNHNLKKKVHLTVSFLIVQVEVHSSSSGAGSGSEESLSVSSTSEGTPPVLRNQKNVNQSHAIANGHDHDHDYEDIYLVREEAKTTAKPKFGTGRSRSRDSGSHSRSASASSAHSTDVIIQYGSQVNSPQNTIQS